MQQGTYELHSTNQDRLLDNIPYDDFLHRIPPTLELGERPNCEDIPTLRLLIQLPIRYFDGVLLEITVCVKVPYHQTAPLLPRVLRGWSNRQLEPSPAVTICAVVVKVIRPSLVLGNNSDDDFPQRLALGNWPRDDVRNASITNDDLFFTLVDNFDS